MKRLCFLLVSFLSLQSQAQTLIERPGSLDQFDWPALSDSAKTAS